MKDRFNLIRERTLGGSKLATFPVPEAVFWELVSRLTGPWRVRQVAVLATAPPLVEAQHVRGWLELWVIERSLQQGKLHRTATKVTPLMGRQSVAVTIQGSRVTSRYLVVHVEGYQTVRVAGGWAWSVRLSLIDATHAKKPPSYFAAPTLDTSISCRDTGFEAAEEDDDGDG